MLTTPFGRIKIIADGHEIAYEAIPYNSTVKSIKLQPLSGSYRITVPAWAYREIRCVVEWNCTPIENTGASGERYRDAEFIRGSDILTIGVEDESPDFDAEKAALGFALFHDPRLSVDNTVSCASCHALETAGVDNHQYSHGVNDLLGGVNAPTVYNAVYNFVQFWDGRAQTLAAQAAGPPLNPVEMASESFDQIIAKLKADRKFAKAFSEVYPDGLTEANITDAIEQFERTLITPDSPFDKWLRGDDSALTAEELEGYELFKKYDCATCHVGPNLGGLTYELMGLRRHYFAERGLELTHEDNGRFKETGLERDRHRFKVPGLRNVEHTWPYYHDGTRETLEEAVRDMGLYQSGVELTEGEIAAITAFLNTLTGEYNGVPVTTTNSRHEIHGH